MSSSFVSIKKAASQELNYMKGRMEGNIQSLRTPWKKFNAASMNGIEWGTITTIAGMSGSGKTAVLNQCETALFELNKQQNFAVLSFNFEMIARRLVGRKISRQLNKPLKSLYSAEALNPKDNLTEEDYRKAVEYCNYLSDLPITYVDIPKNPQQIKEIIINFNQLPENQARKILVTLDHSILVKKRGAKNELETLYELGEIFTELKKLIDVSFIVLSQLNRNIESVERRENKRLHYPVKSDVFGADALYQHSDIFLVTHRPEMLNLRHYGPEEKEVRDMIYWHFLKCRDGDPLIAKMKNELKYNRVVDYEEQEEITEVEQNN